MEAQKHSNCKLLKYKNNNTKLKINEKIVRNIFIFMIILAWIAIYFSNFSIQRFLIIFAIETFALFILLIILLCVADKQRKSSRDI